MYYHICEYCGAALDPSERCDCRKDCEQKQTKEKQTASRHSFTPFVSHKSTGKGDY